MSESIDDFFLVYSGPPLVRPLLKHRISGHIISGVAFGEGDNFMV
jgi:hypothetical protein